MKVYVEIGEVANMLVNWLNSGDYHDVLEALNGETKDEVFRAACLVLPSIILAKCTKY